MYNIFVFYYRLIEETRTPVDRTNVRYANIWSKNNVEALLLKPVVGDDSEDIWPLLWFVSLKTLPNSDPNVCKNLDDLDLMARQ